MRSLALLSLLVLTGLFCTAQTIPTGLPAKMDSIFHNYNNLKGPGCAVLVVKNGKVIFKKGYGLANLEYDIPITPASVFDIASVSKQFTGFAISTLIQQGKISPDDDIHKYLPDVPQFGKTITIRHLIHHTSGLRDWPEALHVAGWRWDEVMSFDDIMRMVKYQKELDFEPGSQYQYSNTGYNLLVAIIEKVTGKTFAKWADENIFKPLGMNNSHISDNYSGIVKNRAVSYFPTGNSFGTSADVLTAVGSSSIFTSVEDLGKWVIHFQQAIDGKDPVYMRMLQEDTLNNKSINHYAYGLAIATKNGRKNVSHNGSWAGYRTVITNYPGDKLSIIILGNISEFNPDASAAQIASYLFKEKPQPRQVADNLMNAPTIKVDTLILKKYAGSYQLLPGWYVTLTLENGQLMVQANGEDKFETAAKTDTSFWVQAYGASVTFLKGPTGEFNSLQYKNYKAKRIVPINLTSVLLGQYTGTYYSQELETTYKIYLDKGKLFIHHMRLGEIAVDPDIVTPDQFSSNVGSLHFIKDKQDKITGFKLSGGRVKNILFEKKADQKP